MFGYQYMHMHMSGLYQGDREISPADAFAQGFMTVHTEMEMDMHMLEVMHAPTDRLTLMAMLPYKEMSMKHLMNTGMSFSQTADGIGDLEVIGLYTVLGDIRKGGHRLVLNAGVSFPTGSINAKDHAGGNPANALVLLEYPMQLGSGTYDLMPGVTYLGDAGPWSWGAQTVETVHLGRNDHGYRFGDQYRVSAWGAYGITDWFAPSVRLDGRWWEDVTGADPGLAANVTPEARPNLRGGRRLDLLFGLNFYVPKGFLKGSRFMAEGGFDIVIFLTGVGTRALTRVVETVFPVEQFVAALRKITIVARGPKPVAALKELDVPVTVAVPEPNTWRDLLRTLDAQADAVPLKGRQVAVQEYGTSNPELLAGLSDRGAQVTRVPVYEWGLPENIEPLRAAVSAIVDNEFDVILLTTGIQVNHLFQVAAEMNQEDAMRQGLSKILIASIGPVTSERLREYGLQADIEPTHPKMGYLVSETAQRSAEILRQKRSLAK